MLLGVRDAWEGPRPQVSWAWILLVDGTVVGLCRDAFSPQSSRFGGWLVSVAAALPKQLVANFQELIFRGCSM